jgi:hypothetical protein
MNKISLQNELDELIQGLEIRQNGQWNQLNNSFAEVADQLQPINIVKNSLKEIKLEKLISEKLVFILFGLGVGYLSERFSREDAHKKFRSILAGLVQSEITLEEQSQTAKINLYSKIAYNVISHLLPSKIK